MNRSKTTEYFGQVAKVCRNATGTTHGALMTSEQARDLGVLLISAAQHCERSHAKSSSRTKSIKSDLIPVNHIVLTHHMSEGNPSSGHITILAKDSKKFDQK